MLPDWYDLMALEASQGLATFNLHVAPENIVFVAKGAADIAVRTLSRKDDDLEICYARIGKIVYIQVDPETKGWAVLVHKVKNHPVHNHVWQAQPLLEYIARSTESIVHCECQKALTFAELLDFLDKHYERD